jgi:hypothetical protein
MAIGPSTIRRASSLVAPAFFALTFLNLFAFLLFTAYLGGAALWGKEEGGRYYVGSHGHYTEVSRRVYGYSEAQGRAVEITMPLAMLIGLVFTLGPGRKSNVTLSHSSKRRGGGA